MTPVDSSTSSAERIEIRVLGSLRVRRADGAIVQPAQWRTSQTADLLRLLALRVNEPVAVDVLVDALWPRVDETRGRASLRTAASGIRKVLGEDCVQRSLGGLMLTGAWVDAQAFRTLAHLARRHVVTGSLAKAVTTTREADALYRGEFRAHNDNAEWGAREREALAATFREMIADAAEAAAALGWWHDAVDLAKRTLAVEPCSERGFRALMRAERGLGETSRALKTFDRCRRVIAAEVGADPSAETQLLHLELLAEHPVRHEPAPFNGRAHETAWLRELAETSAATREPTLVCVLGGAGEGKSRLVEHAFSGGGSPLHTITCAPDVDPWPALVEAIGAATDDSRSLPRAVLVPRHGPVTVLLDDAHHLPAPAVEKLAEQLASLRGPVCVAVAARPTLADGRAEYLVRVLGDRASLLTLPPLAAEEVAGLCAGLLQGEASCQLTTEVVARTGGSPGAVITLVREWTASGRVAATSSGLVVLHSEVPGCPGTPVGRLMSEAVETLSPAVMEVLHLAVVVGRPVTAELLRPLTTELAPLDKGEWLRATLDHLTDATLLVWHETGLVPRDELLGDLILTWLRPSARRRLHRRIAELAHISAAERAEHWSEAGEPQLASAASAEAATDAVGEHEYEAARVHLRRLCGTSEANGVPPADRVDLYERWGDAAAALGRTHEARAAFAAGASVARSYRLPSHERLEAKSGLAVDAQPAPSARPHAPASAVAVREGHAPNQDDLDLRLHRAVQEADSRGDHEEGALARAELVREVCLPQRQLCAARRWTEQALQLTTDPRACAEVLVAAWMGGAVLGEAGSTEEALGRAAALLGPGESFADLAVLRALVAHDLGRPEFPALQAEAMTYGSLTDPLRHQWIAIRTAAERHDLAAATLADQLPTPSGTSPIVRQLRNCASAALAMHLGQAERAHGLLLDVLDIARMTGSTLVVPEAAARLVVLEAHVDLASARRRFEQFDEAVGADNWLPRENVLKLIARAAIRTADRRPDEGASAAAAAADEAENAGLVLLAADAHRHRAVHLAAAGRPYEARLAVTAARRWMSAALPSVDRLTASDRDLVELTGSYGLQRPRLFARSAHRAQTNEAPAV